MHHAAQFYVDLVQTKGSHSTTKLENSLESPAIVPSRPHGFHCQKVQEDEQLLMPPGSLISKIVGPSRPLWLQLQHLQLQWLPESRLPNHLQKP